MNSKERRQYFKGASFLIGRKVYFKLPKKSLIPSGISDLTPGKLYTLVDHNKCAKRDTPIKNSKEVGIYDDNNTLLFISLITESAHLGFKTKWILKRETKNG